MQSAETVLGIIRNRGSKGLPLQGLYRQLFNPALYLLAYDRIARNSGAMTPGVTTETVDGMSLKKIQDIIELLRSERFRWTPVRRVSIEKQHSTKKRPLGVPTWSDKLVQEVIRLLLEAYYEPQFSAHSHGFRQGHGCHTALRQIQHAWHGTVWFIEGDIAACFDSLDHATLQSILARQVHDNRFLRLVANLLQAGYLEGWRYHATLSGTPQGGIVSPMLANIYLNELDQFVERTLIPAHTHGARRKRNPAYHAAQRAAAHSRKRRQYAASRTWRRLARALPACDPDDPEYERLRYVRYADDFLLGCAGPRAQAEETKRQLGEYLRDQLKLELSEAKTLITHGSTEAARFLGYEISTFLRNERLNAKGHRSINRQIALKVPAEVVKAKASSYMRHGKAVHRAERMSDDAFSIVARYQAEYRGLVNYYRMAHNVACFSRLKLVMTQSLVATLAAKWRTSVQLVYRRLHATVDAGNGPSPGLRVTVPRDGKPPLVAIWGGISLARRADAVLNDSPPLVWNTRSDLVQRLLADTCELCGSQEQVEVHHIRALRDLQRKGRRELPPWAQQMAARRRKTLAVCRQCHLQVIHRDGTQGTANRFRRRVTGERYAPKGARTVRRGARGKGAVGHG